MASNTTSYTPNTVVNIFRFDSLDEYRDWLSKHSGSDFVAFVKEESPKNGYDLYVNEHALTKTKFLLLDSNGMLTEISQFDNKSQYSVVGERRTVLGQRQIILKRLVISEDSIIDTITSLVNQKVTEEVNNKNQELLGMLTKSHYIFRKLFALLADKTQDLVSFSFSLLDENGNTVAQRIKRGTTVRVKSFKIDNLTISSDLVTLERADIYLGNTTVDSPLKTVVTDDPSLMCNVYDLNQVHTMTSDTTFTVVLKYAINDYDWSRINLEQNYDKSIESFTNQVTQKSVSKTYNFPEINYRYAFIIPVDSQGRFVSPLSSIDDLQTVHYLCGDSRSSLITAKVVENGSIEMNVTQNGYIYTARPATQSAPTYTSQALGPYTMDVINEETHDSQTYKLYRSAFPIETKGSQIKVVIS